MLACVVGTPPPRFIAAREFFLTTNFAFWCLEDTYLKIKILPILGI
jgi:hypothetical protein